MKTFDTLSQAITDLKQRGYVHDFNLQSECIHCAPLNRKFEPYHFHVDEVHRFEGMTNPSDSSVLFAISTVDGVKGLLVDAYGMYAESLSPQMIEKLTIDYRTNL